MSDPLPEVPVWVHTQATCGHCGHAWVAVHPRDAERLECPTCGEFTRAMHRVRPHIPGWKL